MKLAGKAALVTGASRGIGRACASALAREGARLCLVARDAVALSQAAEEVRALGATVLALDGDVSDEAFAAMAVGETEERLGPLSVLVNNAGIIEVARVTELPTAAWDRVLDVNLKGAFLFSREAVRRMVPRHAGRLIAVTSISATEGTPRLSAYCASKWGLSGLIKTLAAELQGTGVVSMGVAPGSVDTDMLRRSGFSPDMSADDIAVVVRFLATEAPAAMQGSIVEVFG
jgi:3-oxoacyl-[acyl-carrier protein] reductase